MSFRPLSLVVFVEVTSGHTRPSVEAPVYHGRPAWTHRCAPESRMTPRQRANPSWCGWSRDVLRSVRSRFTRVEGGENDCSCLTLTPLLDLKRCPRSQSSSFSVIRTISIIFLQVLGALFNSSSCSRSHRTFLLACCRQCRNPSCSREWESVSFSGD